MPNNQNLKTPEPDHKGLATASLVLGNISLVLGPGIAMLIYSLVFYPLLQGAKEWTLFPPLGALVLVLLSYPIALIISLIGLILGILGRKSIRKKSAIAGIKVCLIVIALSLPLLGCPIYFLFFL